MWPDVEFPGRRGYREADNISEPSLTAPPILAFRKLAQHIIETKSADFDPAMLEDHYRNALVRILRKKQSKRSALPPTVSPSRENIIDLMDALKRSIADARPAAKSISRRGALKGAAAKRAMRARRAR